LAELFDQINREQLARGYLGRPAAEMLAEQTLRQQEDNDYEARCEAIWTQQERNGDRYQQGR
jgi:hypothetical protein